MNFEATSQQDAVNAVRWSGGWKTSCEQLRLDSPLECLRGGRRRDMERQTVPHSGSCELRQETNDRWSSSSVCIERAACAVDKDRRRWRDSIRIRAENRERDTAEHPKQNLSPVLCTCTWQIARITDIKSVWISGLSAVYYCRIVVLRYTGV